MIVIVGRTHLEDHEIDVLRLGLDDRQTVLERAKKANESASLPTRDADNEIYIVKKLMTLFDPIKHTVEETRRTQQDMFTGRPSQSVEDAAKDAEREAARRIRHREIVRAIGGMMGTSDDYNIPDGGWTDTDLRAVLLSEFETVEHEDHQADGGERDWPGIYKHETTDGKTVWCAVSVDGAVERFWYGIDPELVKFNPQAQAATLTGADLIPFLREAWGLETPVDYTAMAERMAAYVAPEKGDKAYLEGSHLDGWHACLAEATEVPIAELESWIRERMKGEPDDIAREETERDAGYQESLRDLLFCVVEGNTNEEEDEARAEETPEEWSHRIRPSPVPDPKKEITNEMVVQTLHSILVLDIPVAAAAWQEFARQPRTDGELLQQVTDHLIVRSQGKNKISGTEMIGTNGNADVLQPIAYDLTIDPLRIVCGKGKGKRPIDGDSLLVLIRALFEIERPESVAPEDQAIAVPTEDVDAAQQEEAVPV